MFLVCWHCVSLTFACSSRRSLWKLRGDSATHERMPSTVRWLLSLGWLPLRPLFLNVAPRSIVLVGLSIVSDRSRSNELRRSERSSRARDSGSVARLCVNRVNSSNGQWRTRVAERHPALAEPRFCCSSSRSAAAATSGCSGWSCRARSRRVGVREHTSAHQQRRPFALALALLRPRAQTVSHCSDLVGSQSCRHRTGVHTYRLGWRAKDPQVLQTARVQGGGGPRASYGRRKALTRACSRVLCALCVASFVHFGRRLLSCASSPCLALFFSAIEKIRLRGC